ncbi:citrate synthase [Embleya scabrispora]|uniref:citrate synthase n=1 Tax=Embleya scabrispora TaxID=159449 RepID=UPI00036E0448|nr:citrate synthase [Embleya scabrispora]MYS84009.1 helix-turn-helix domain-containing protein [Streptomyces sp. SID5474]
MACRRKVAGDASEQDYPSDYLTTAQAAQRLGVKPETIYAYVSRGLLTSVRESRQRGSRFATAEVEALAERTGGRREPNGSIERIHTHLTLLAGDRLYYRGRDVSELAEYRLESVAHWLWRAELADVSPFEVTAERADSVRRTVALLPDTARLIDRIRMIVAATGTTDPLRYDLSEPAVVRGGETLLAMIVDALPSCAGAQPPTGRALAERLWPKLTARPATPARLRLLNAALVSMADHDLAVSTLAARVAASARADVYAVVSAGLGVVDGRHHGAAIGLAHRFLRDALDPAGGPTIAVADRLRAGEHLPGLGHVLYVDRDPRADLVLDLLREQARDDDRVARVTSAVDALTRETAARENMFANVDLALAALTHALDMRPDAGEAIFAIARSIGWLAHALEEYQQPGLRYRAVGVYTGPRPAGGTAADAGDPKTRRA